MDDSGRSRTSRASLLVFGLWMACALGVILYLLLGAGWFGRPAPGPGQAPAGVAATGPGPAAPTAGGDARTPYPAYEETLGTPILQVARQVDYAIMASLLLAGHPPSHLTLAAPEVRRFHGEPYLHQDLVLELDSDPERFTQGLRQSVAKWAPQAELRRAGDTPAGQEVWTVSVAGQETHRMTIALVPGTSDMSDTGAEPPAGERARLALVIDDMGQDMAVAHALADLEHPPTFSILPGTPHSAEVAALARAKGIETLLHLPMQPRGYPEVNPGPGALFTDMDAPTLRRVLGADLGQVAGAVGVNNHMGSLFTQDEAGMDVVLAELARRGLFFLDSLTTPRSAAAGAARKSGERLYKRDVFLDNVRDTKAILRQLAKAERIALRHGQAVAIGHPYPETLAAIRRWQEEGPRVDLAPLASLKPAS